MKQPCNKLNNVNKNATSCWQLVPNLLTTCNKQCEYNLLTACLQTCYKLWDFYVGIFVFKDCKNDRFQKKLMMHNTNIWICPLPKLSIFRSPDIIWLMWFIIATMKIRKCLEFYVFCIFIGSVRYANKPKNLLFFRSKINHFDDYILWKNFFGLKAIVLNLVPS